MYAKSSVRVLVRCTSLQISWKCVVILILIITGSCRALLHGTTAFYKKQYNKQIMALWENWWRCNLPGRNGIIRWVGFLAPASSGNKLSSFTFRITKIIYQINILFQNKPQEKWLGKFWRQVVCLVEEESSFSKYGFWLAAPEQRYWQNRETPNI